MSETNVIVNMARLMETMQSVDDVQEGGSLKVCKMKSEDQKFRLLKFFQQPLYSLLWLLETYSPKDKMSSISSPFLDGSAPAPPPFSSFDNCRVLSFS